MFNLFKKQQSVSHSYKNLTLALPSAWEYELEEGDLEACFDPKSQGTLRLHIIKAVSPENKTAEEDIKSLTSNEPYITTQNGYLLTNSTCTSTTESGKNLTLISRRLINAKGKEKIIAVLTYTVLTAEKDNSQEKEVLNLIEESLKNAKLE